MSLSSIPELDFDSKAIYKRTYLICSYFFSLFISAVISELIHYTAAGSFSGGPAHMPLIQVIVPHVMNLKSQLRDTSKVF